MTNERREWLIESLLNRPDTLTADDIEAIVADEELRQLYETAAVLKGACMKERTYQLDEEWEKFRERIDCSEEGKRDCGAIACARFAEGNRTSLGRIAATVALLVALGAVAATMTLRSGEGEEPTASDTGIEGSCGQTSGITVIEEPDTVRLASPLCFENQPLAEIARTAGDSLRCKVVLGDSQLGELRLYLSLPAGSTAADFASRLDAYEMFSASLHDNVVSINRKEGAK